MLIHIPLFAWAQLPKLGPSCFLVYLFLLELAMRDMYGDGETPNNCPWDHFEIEKASAQLAMEPDKIERYILQMQFIGLLKPSVTTRHRTAEGWSKPERSIPVVL